MTTNNTAMATKPVDAELVVDDPNARVPQRITTPTQYRASLEQWQRQGLNILTPATNFSGLQEGFAMFPAVVRLNPNIDEGDVYKDSQFKSGEVALTKDALNKIAQAAGMSIKTHRTDDRSIPNYWEVQAAVRFVGLDGSTQELTAMQEWDMRDGSARSKGMKSDAERQRARLNGLRSCEARAINAAIRLFGVKQKYSLEEVSAPFMCVRVMYVPDQNDPEVRRMLAERALAGTSTLFGSAPRAVAPELLGTIGAMLEEARPPVAAAVTGTTAPAAAAEKPADPSAPPCEGAVRIERVDEKKGVNAKTQRPWTRFEVTDSNGEICSTFDTKIAEVATRAAKDRTWVELTVESNGNFRNLIEIMPAGQQPGLPSMGDL